MIGTSNLLRGIAYAWYTLVLPCQETERLLSDEGRLLLDALLLAKTSALPARSRHVERVGLRSRRHIAKINFRNRLCSTIMEEFPDPFNMRMKDIKDELDARNVAWKGKAVDQESLAAMLKEARANPPDNANTSPPLNANLKNRKNKDIVTENASGGSETIKIPDRMSEEMDGDLLQAASSAARDPKVMELMSRALKNPKIMKILEEAQSNKDLDGMSSKYEDDPEMKKFVEELTAALGLT
mmetsp:Transcript_57204/g.90933  ORF Transcript_57204/g.90933 Transcript_57204/m.90933 type:complete len:241 (-) Transcript_57204:76-798(-)